MASNRFGAPMKGMPVSSATAATAASAKPSGQLRPEPTAVPPRASSSRWGKQEAMRLALSVDAQAYPDYLLVNTIRQREAVWYLNNLDRFFLIDPEEEGFE